MTLSVLETVYDVIDDDLKDLPSALRLLARAARNGRSIESSHQRPHRIRFPYSRHSSYSELCQLVQALRPRDVWPCTVQLVRWIKEGLNPPAITDGPLVGTRTNGLHVGITIEELFGSHCRGTSFDHDHYMSRLAATLEIEESQQHESPVSSDPVFCERQSSPPKAFEFPAQERIPFTASLALAEENSARHGGLSPDQGRRVTDPTRLETDNSRGLAEKSASLSGKRAFHEFAKQTTGEISTTNYQETLEDRLGESGQTFDSQERMTLAWRAEIRRDAFNAMQAIIKQSGEGGWAGLLCTTNNHADAEEELGEIHSIESGSP